MPLNTGARLGPYEILAQIGAGGMGEVYRARDMRLDRSVAIKVLSAEIASDPEYRERLVREARLVSSLNHPNICILYDIGRQEDLDYLVMEYLEGETLQSRLHRGPLPSDQLLRLALEVAGALALAHRNGVFHRDLKPGNIMLVGPRSRPIAKLLDFGLAKTGPVPGVRPDDRTASRLLTQRGVILGTVPYMSPEQLEGKALDARTDIFSFGAILFEMATGRRAFSGGSQASMIAAVLRENPPPLHTLPETASLPRGLDRIVCRCLAKDPEERWQCTQDLASELSWVAEEPESFPPAPSAGRSSRTMRVALFALAVLALALGAGVWQLWRQRSPASALALSVLPPEKTSFESFELSPEGRSLLFVGRSDDQAREQLWVRSLATGDARALPGTEGAAAPFWSPDGRAVAFFTPDRKLKRIRLADGQLQTLADAPNGRGGAWSPAGAILFAPSGNSVLYQVPEGGGASTPVTSFARAHSDNSHRWPQFLPDGRQFLYLSRGSTEDDGIFAQSLGDRQSRVILRVDSAAVYTEPGYLLWVQQGVLRAQRFRLDRLALEGTPASLASPILSTDRRLGFSVSSTGVLAYRIGQGEATSRLAWFDRQGRLLEWVSPIGHVRCPELSPDGKRVVWERLDPQQHSYDLYLMDLASRVPSRFTFHAADDSNAAWSADGRWILFTSNRRKTADLYRKDASGAGEEETVFLSEQTKNLDQWSADGRYAVFTEPVERGRNDLWGLALAGERRTFPLVVTPANEVQGVMSPNGRWLAYASDESGVLDVYVRPFTPSGSPASGKWQISTGGGGQPRWSRDGKELFYLSNDRKLVAVRVSTEKERFEVLGSQTLFATGVTSLTNARNHYTVSPDGQRFLINVRAEEDISRPVHILVSWTSRLTR
jgi:serine/threonine protein kinase